jgi:DNA-directed RNA polymerase subunit beta
MTDLSFKLRRTLGSSPSSSRLEPDLTAMQLSSYMEDFLQYYTKPSERKLAGLQEIFKSIFPIKDPGGAIILDFVSYRFESPRYEVKECKVRGTSYTCQLKVLLRLTVLGRDEETKAEIVRHIKEQEVLLCDVPIMTDSGTCIINGVEKVVVAQMHRSPGVFFGHDEGRGLNSNGKNLYSARVIPYRGAWLDLEFDSKDLIHFRIDKKKKLPVTTLLKALGMSSAEILNFYYDSAAYKRCHNGWKTDFNPERVEPANLKNDLIDASSGEVLLKAGQRINKRTATRLYEAGCREVLVDLESLAGKFLSKPLIGPDGAIIVPEGCQLGSETLARIIECNIEEFSLLLTGEFNGSYVRDTLFADKNHDQEAALIEICKILRPGEFAASEVGKNLIEGLFFNSERYDLSVVGRIKLNAKLGLDKPIDLLTLTPDDIKHVVKVLAEVKDGRASLDDIDHLGIRRVRTPGELIGNQFRLALIRIQKGVLERVSSIASFDDVMPQEFVNVRLLSNALREFFNTSALCQLMDQTNPLAEITHKRRLSALGPGGVSRERAGLEIRDVHTTHYGKICPVETPEGQNIGLISSLTTYARVNPHGFIETPYRKVVEGRVTDEVVYLSALEEEKCNVAQANCAIDKNGYLLDEVVPCRFAGEFGMLPRSEVHFMCVNNMQVFSVAAALIPFLENNDANRALMGSNMQRQAVPLLTSEAPLVGTGIEGLVSRSASTSLIAPTSGVIEHVDNERIILNSCDALGLSDNSIKVYHLTKFERSNYNTCVNQRPLVYKGQKVNKGDILADGPSSDKGELALGKNVLIAFLPFKGYTFQDSIVISERLVKDDIFTSIRIEELEVVVRDTRLGPEEITRDIHNASEESLMHLDEVGIVQIGSKVAPGDVLVGKVTPKGEAPVTPEEKLLRAIFGEKAHDVINSSLYVPSGVRGTVIDVRIFSRRGVEKDQRSLMLEKQRTDQIMADHKDELNIANNFMLAALLRLLIGQKVLKWESRPSGLEITSELLRSVNSSKWWDISVTNESVNAELAALKESHVSFRKNLEKKLAEKLAKLQAGDELPQGALKVVKVFIANRCQLQPGDKMSGRHGNKGVISTIVPEEDMPFFEDGTTVDVVLSSLGIPSRMNIGQVLETHLGWASTNLGKKFAQLVDSTSSEKVELIKALAKEVYGDEVLELSDAEVAELACKLKKGVPFATPVFDGAKIKDIKHMLAAAGVSTTGQSRLRDGASGEYLDREVTVGYQYLLKLHHLVDNKVHARSVGPYSLITQQPLGGKMHFGGQRLGEMECWALQAYGAAYTLQEMLTVKSDDVVGRTRMYEAITKGDHAFHCGVPESFNVMVKELQALCLDIRLERKEEIKN